MTQQTAVCAVHETEAFLADNSVLDTTVRLIRVFLASPGDVPEERARASTVIARVNERHALSQGILLQLWRWEKDAVPEVGRAQENINRSLDGAAVVVLIIWNRIGTPTGEAESGTVEEFERAVERNLATGWPRVMVYYCDRPSPPATTEDQLEQAGRVLKFKKRHQRDVLSASYGTASDFEQLLETHLDKVVDDIASLSNPTRCRKVLYVKVTSLRRKGAAGVEPLYQRQIDRLPADASHVEVFDEAVYYALEMFPGKRMPTNREDVSSGVIDPRLIVPFQHPIVNADDNAIRNPGRMPYQFDEECDTILTVSHFVNGLQHDDEYISSRLTDDVEFIRMIVDFSSVPNASRIVEPGTATVGSGRAARDVPVVAYGDAMFMLYCENGTRGELLKFNFHLNWSAA